MLSTADFKPGVTVTIVHGTDFMGLQNRDGSRSTWHYTPLPTTHTVLVVDPQALICTGNTAQEHFAQWVKDACKQAGLDPAVGICLGYYGSVTLTLGNLFERVPELLGAIEKLRLPQG